MFSNIEANVYPELLGMAIRINSEEQALDCPFVRQTGRKRFDEDTEQRLSHLRHKSSAYERPHPWMNCRVY